MSLLALQNKLEYRNCRSTEVPCRTVLDFQRLKVRYWNDNKLTKRQERLFNKLCQWNNVWVARKQGYVWCSWCRDKGYRYLRRGICRCSCAVTGYAELGRKRVVSAKRIGVGE